MPAPPLPAEDLPSAATPHESTVAVTSPLAVADDGGFYDDFDESPQNLARLPRHQEEQDSRRQERIQLDKLRQVWAEYAERLADWTERCLVNRRDVWGRYRSLYNRYDETAITMPPRADRGRTTLQRDDLVAHYKGEQVQDLIGLHSTSQQNTCKWIALDIDRHDEDPNPPDADQNLRDAMRLYDALIQLGLRPLLTESNGNGGYHIRVIFSAAICAGDAYAFAQAIAALAPGRKIETSPKQAKLTGEAVGNWLRLPGRHHTRCQFSRVYADGEWLDGAEAIERILAIRGDDADIVRNAVEAEQATHNGRQGPATSPAATPATIATCAVAGWLRDILQHVPAGHFDEYDDWLRIGRIIHHELPDADGLSLWDEVSRRSAKHEADACRRKWEGFASDGICDRPVTVGTLAHWIEEEQPDFSPPRRPEPANEASTTAPVKLPKPVGLGKLFDEDPERRRDRPIVFGFMRAGDVVNIVGVAKAGKSWLAGQLAVSVAMGLKLFDSIDVRQGHVLVLDNELSRNELRYRYASIAEAMGTSATAIDDRIAIYSLKGQGVHIALDGGRHRSLTRRVDVHSLLPAKGKYAVIIIDSLYRFARVEESSNEQMAEVYEALHAYAAQTGAAIVVIHHAGKAASEKSFWDFSRGASSIGAAVNAQMVLREHAVEDAVVMEVRGGTWPRDTIPPMVLRRGKDCPVWVPDTDGLDLEALAKKNGGGRSNSTKGERRAATPADGEARAREFVNRFLPDLKPRPLSAIQQEAIDAGFKRDEVKGRIGQAEEHNLIRKVSDPADARIKHYQRTTSPPPSPAAGFTTVEPEGTEAGCRGGQGRTE